MKYYGYIAVLVYAVTCFLPVSVYAQTSQVLSVTPPLFQLSAGPGDVWQSSVKVVNGNNYPMTVYAEVVNFQATGEVGQGKFVPILDDADLDQRVTLAEWIEIPPGPHVISSEQTKDIPFFVDMPEDASPGGHYAAILITTQPPESGDERVAVKTSQTVTSLFFVRISGDIDEHGTIREFRAVDSFVERPEVELSLRFENKGNVHLQPRGNIVITNMWGTERGVIPVNYQSHFGNVLPKSIREFKFVWKGDFSITDIGRYTAEVALVYGEKDSKTVTGVLHFWIVPLKATAITLLVLGLFITTIVWMVKAYVRRMLTLAGVEVGRADENRQSNVASHTYARAKYRNVSAPIKDGVLDLRNRLSTVEETMDIPTTIISFMRTYKTFFFALCALVFIVATMFVYIKKATEEHNRYSVTIQEAGSETVLEGKDVQYIEAQ